jgi:Insertion element 4 transposase N-terminal/Transposase DDE domain
MPDGDGMTEVLPASRGPQNMIDVSLVHTWLNAAYLGVAGWWLFAACRAVMQQSSWQDCVCQDHQSMPGASLPDHVASAGGAGASVFPLALMDEVIGQAGCRERRRRLLPAAAVMIFVLGCALFSADGYGEVARKLEGWLAPLAGPGGWRVPGSCALARARRRLGPRPFELLFAALAGPLAGPGSPGASAFGRLLVALDGTVLDVPFTTENVAAFGPPPRGARDGAFPQERVVVLAGCGSRGLIAAAAGPRTGRGGSGQHLARVIASGGALGPGMLALADRNFSGHPVVAALTATGADVLIRAKTSQRLPVISVLPDGSYTSMLADPPAARARHRRNAQRAARGSTLGRDNGVVPGIAVRVIEAGITITAAGQPPRTEHCRLITTLTDPATAPAAQLAACYAQRWEIETGYREIKTFTRGARRVLRSRDPAGITQETWALLCATQLIHTARATAATAGGHDPDRISYTITLHAIRRALTPHTATSITAEALSNLLPATRRRRAYPRLAHTSTTKRRQARAHLAGTTTYKITIVAPAQASDLPGP